MEMRAAHRLVLSTRLALMNIHKEVPKIVNAMTVGEVIAETVGHVL